MKKSLRHAAYLHLRASRDPDDQADVDADNGVNDARGRLRATVWLALHTLGTDALSKAAATNPALNRVVANRSSAGTSATPSE